MIDKIKNAKTETDQLTVGNEYAVNGVVAGAMNKTLIIAIAIRNTVVDSGLKKINETLVTIKREEQAVEAAASGQ